MSFDLYGVKPMNEKGEYFRNNVWYWRPLWIFVCETCQDILTIDQKLGGHTNNGVVVTQDQARRIAVRLSQFEERGKIAEFERMYKKEMVQSSEKYPFEEENLRRFIRFCLASGGFKIQ